MARVAVHHIRHGLPVVPGCSDIDYYRAEWLRQSGYAIRSGGVDLPVGIGYGCSGYQVAAGVVDEERYSVLPDHIEILRLESGCVDYGMCLAGVAP